MLQSLTSPIGSLRGDLRLPNRIEEGLSMHCEAGGLPIPLQLFNGDACVLLTRYRVSPDHHPLSCTIIYDYVIITS
jgi:hypothetical protein